VQHVASYLANRSEFIGAEASAAHVWCLGRPPVWPLVSVAPAERSRFTVNEIVVNGILFRQITYRFLPSQTLRQTPMTVSKFPTSFRYLAASEIRFPEESANMPHEGTHLGLKGAPGGMVGS
jgi:hypothetical protein